MRRQLTFFLIVFLGLGASSAMAQGQPLNSYTFYDLRAGGEAVCSGGLIVDDFATSIANQHDGEILMNITLTYTGSDPNFSFWAESPGGTADGNVFTYNLPAIPAKDSIAINVISVALPLSTSGIFEGEMAIWSTNGETFYVMPPNDFTVTSPSCAGSFWGAFHSAWQAGSWGIPWFWNGYEEILVSPYANHWHNDGSWPEGWNSEITVTNQGGQTVAYTLTYARHVWGAGGLAPQSFDPNDSCAASTLNRYAYQVVTHTNTWVLNLRDDVFDPESDHAVKEDGFVYLALYPVIGNTLPTHYVVPMSGSQSNTC